MISKTKLVNLSTPDAYIGPLKTSDPQLYQAIINLASSSKQLINNVFPSQPSVGYKGRIILPGVLAADTDVLSHRYHVVLPIDNTGYWKFTQINLTNCWITVKTLGVVSIDIKVSQQKGTSAWKSLFKPGFNPMLPFGTVSTSNVKFAINTLYQDDLGRVDVLAADGTVADVEVVLIGNYSLSESTIN